MLMPSVSRIVLVATLACGAAVVSAQQMPNPYGPPVTLEAAKKIAAPALAEARKNGWTMAVAIVDPAGDLVYFERMDNTQLGSINTAINKARSAARFKRPTKVFQDMVASGGEGLRALGLEGASRRLEQRDLLGALRPRCHRRRCRHARRPDQLQLRFFRPGARRSTMDDRRWTMDDGRWTNSKAFGHTATFRARDTQSTPACICLPRAR